MTPITHKMYCIFAQESLDKMKGLRGKLSSMAGHAFLHAFWDATAYPRTCVKNTVNAPFQQAVDYQLSGCAAKITLVVDTVEELKALQESYKGICGTSLVTDQGRTALRILA